MRRTRERAAPTLTIRVTFEFSHTGAESLAAAYEQVLPRRRRILTMTAPGNGSHALAAQPSVERSRAWANG